MKIGILGTNDDIRTERFYHGTRAEFKQGDLIEPSNPPNVGERDMITTYVSLTPNLDAAIWEAELAAGEGRGRVYIVQPTGPIEDDPNLTNKKFRGNPTKSFRSREPLRITGGSPIGKAIRLKCSRPCKTDLNEPSDLVLSQLRTERRA
jgi:Rifampin ADP-ribosyl transferase